jgi:hypothetical protein
MESEWLYLDPDYRNNAPAQGKYCCRCMKALKEKYLTGELSEDFTHFRLNDKGEYYIGIDCYKQISKSPKY